MREPSSKTSSSRLRITETARRRASTSSSSSSACFSSVFSRSVEATRWQSALGLSTLAAAISSSSGRYGTSAMIRAKSPWTFRVSASTWVLSAVTSGTASNSPTRYGSAWTHSFARILCSPCTNTRSVPSGTRISLWMIAAVPTS